MASGGTVRIASAFAALVQQQRFLQQLDFLRVVTVHVAEQLAESVRRSAMH